MFQQPQASDRIRAAVPVLAVHALLAFVLLRGLAFQPPPAEQRELKLIQLTPEPVPPPEPPPPPPPTYGSSPAQRRADPDPEGAASPPNLKANPSPFVAPEPVVRIPLPPPPIPSAPVSGTGSASSAGAAPVRGPGTGSGGVGSGTGSGSGGSGAGGGGGGGGSGYGAGPVGRLRPPRQIAGSLSIRDMPEALQEAGFEGRVGVLYRVQPDGRASECRVTHSSGSREMDRLTCRLIEQRFRFRPPVDEVGRPFSGIIEQDHYWEADGAPPDREAPRRRRGF